MLKLPLLLLLSCFHSFCLGQKIEYSIPESVEKDINKSDYKIIVDNAVEVIKKRYAINNVKSGTIELEKNQDLTAFNLDNLVLKCLEVKYKALWKDVIRDHFTQIFSSIDEQKKIDPENFETVRKYLSLRIYPKNLVLQRGEIESLVLRSDLEDTYTLLMLDLPGAFTNVQKQVFDLWKKDSADVFLIAQENVNKQEVEKVTQVFDIDKSKIEISLIGEENYAASYALDLARNSPDLVGEWGSVVAIPNKGLVNICKISKDKPLDFVKFIERTKPLIEKSFNDHPQPVSDQYFWYYKGAFTKINIVESKEGRLNILSPAGLTSLMTEAK